MTRDVPSLTITTSTSSNGGGEPYLKLVGTYRAELIQHSFIFRACSSRSSSHRTYVGVWPVVVGSNMSPSVWRKDITICMPGPTYGGPNVRSVDTLRA